MSTPTHTHTFRELELKVDIPDYLIVEDHGNVRTNPSVYIERLAKKRKFIFHSKLNKDSAGTTTYLESIKGENHFFHVIYCYNTEKKELLDIFIRGHEEMHALGICLDITKRERPDLYERIVENTNRISRVLPQLIQGIKNRGLPIGGNEIFADCGGFYAAKKKGFPVRKSYTQNNITNLEQQEIEIALNILAMDKIKTDK